MCPVESELSEPFDRNRRPVFPEFAVKEIRNVFNDLKEQYGYRWIHAVLKTEGKKIFEKVVCRIMREEDLSVRKVKKRKYNSYQGEITPAVENVISRDFYAEKPNEMAYGYH